MSLRQIVLDTETTGIKIEDGHRVIEIGCVELVDRKLTGNHFHCYINPAREIDAEAVAIHGLNQAFLSDKPLFDAIANEFIQFIQNAELIIHNAPFDVAFLNYELGLLQSDFKTINDYCRIIDTLPLARQLHPGQRNNLDALCKRYHVDNSKREWHGALLDASLLAQVYLAMTGGQGSFFDILTDTTASTPLKEVAAEKMLTEKANIVVRKATASEIAAHATYLENMKKQGQCLWPAEGVE